MKYIITSLRLTAEQREEITKHGCFFYHVRWWDDFNGCQIEKRPVIVNHCCDLITDEPITFEDERNIVYDGNKWFSENEEVYKLW